MTVGAGRKHSFPAALCFCLEFIITTANPETSYRVAVHGMYVVRCTQTEGAGLEIT